MNKQVTDYIEAAPEEQKMIMGTVRKIIHASVKQVQEEFKWGRPVFKTEKDFAYFKTAKGYVTVGFMNYHKLKDPDNLLEGTGKDMRHIKLAKISDINDALLKQWFKALNN